MLDKKPRQSNKLNEPVKSFLPKDFLDTTPSYGAVPRLNGYTLNAVFRAAGNQYAISPALLKAIGKALSGLKADAVSSEGNLGLMQLTPAVARMLRIRDPFDPVESIFGGAQYLRQLLNRTRGDLRRALAAYLHGGESNVSAEVPLPRETQSFIELVYALTAAYAGYKEQQQKGEVFAELAALLKKVQK
ncbi:MAG: lytic transglycosylase domain-containing protein [Bacillota bacterium]